MGFKNVVCEDCMEEENPISKKTGGKRGDEKGKNKKGGGKPLPTRLSIIMMIYRYRQEVFLLSRLDHHFPLIFDQSWETLIYYRKMLQSNQIPYSEVRRGKPLREIILIQ